MRAAAVAACVFAACTGELVLDEAPVETWEEYTPSFEEFEASTYREPGPDGVYVVNGDHPVLDRKELREFYNELFFESLAVIHVGGSDKKWSTSLKRKLTYCVSNSFGSRKSEVVGAMQWAASEWEKRGDVDFIYQPQYDATCTASNNSVMFDVRPTSGATYLARAFYPHWARSKRNILVDVSSFTTSWPLRGILAHELGHGLGFAHEHARPESGKCYEGNSWRGVTQYDAYSVMHYPQCNGKGSPLTFSALDAAGVAALYGAPSASSGGSAGGSSAPTTGTKVQGSDSRSVAKGQLVQYKAFDVVPGTEFVATTTGTGDADLFVRFGGPASRQAYHCKSNSASATEACVVDVPGSVDKVHVAVEGFSAASYSLKVVWWRP